MTSTRTLDRLLAFGRGDAVAIAAPDATAAPIELEEFSFTLLLAIMRAAIEYGKLTAPDGRAARSARHDRAGVKFVTLVQAVMIYLEEHPELEPKASAKFANIIRPDILDAMELPRMRSRAL